MASPIQYDKGFRRIIRDGTLVVTKNAFGNAEPKAPSRTAPRSRRHELGSMLPALTTKPKQAVRQVKGLSNDSIDSYANTPLGGGSGIGGGMATSYVDNTEGSGTPRSPPTSSRATINTGRSSVPKTSADEGAKMARVVRDRKASGEEELSLRTGDAVKVQSSKRTGYLKCEAGDEVGYVPSSYLEFLDGAAEAENGTVNAVTEEAQRAEKQRKKQQRREKRKKEKLEANGATDPEEGAPVTARSPRKEVPAAENEGIESPRKSKKKNRKHRQGEDGGRGAASGVDEVPSSPRSRAAPEDTERSRSKSKHSKKKRHRNVDSSDSSESDGGNRSGRRRSHRRRHRRGSSASDSESTSSGYSDGSYRRRRRRRHHRHKRNSSKEEDEDDSDYKRRSRRGKKRRDKGDGDSEPDEGSRSARKAEKKRLASDLHEAEKGVSQLSMKSEEKASEPAQAKATAKKGEPDRERGKKEETERSEGSSEGRATSVSTAHKDDEGRSSTGTSSSSQKQNSSKSGLGRQIGEKMRSFLGGSKKQQGGKSSSGILNACPGTVQGEEGWYEHGENERYYFVLVDGKWSLLYGPMTEEDFEVFSNRLLEQNRSIELPSTYLHKAGYYLNRELRVQKEQ